MTTTEEAPSTVRTAFWLTVAYAVLLVLVALYALASKQVLIDSVIQSGRTSGLSNDQIATAVTRLLIGTTVVNVVFGALAVFFGLKAKAGLSWGRTALAINLGFSLFFQIFTNLLGLLPILVGLAGVVLLFLRPSSDYLTGPKQAE
ncbi:hypothetical protein Lesp02_28900 [Lentzea sp. NBRC 105346]|uniref:hypothetical protein n=1 Tax=Lentzea sp. NBRC 105346 TaxID=3032205 RepID=UPI002557BF0C|nr:hypothetical protein [Lentzea sp. NBRC 105346]GLZ30701.1 hypothetical protein Lesp02_28900 [Lentzea sp. NBRC 105346]